MTNKHGSPIFIVGNSRSGTTLTSNILKSHPLVYCLQEIHFFEQLWKPGDNAKLDRNAAISLGSRLIGIARESRLLLKNVDKYYSEAGAMLADYTNSEITAVDVYKTFLDYESKSNGKQIPCEQTPRYIFYLNEILEIFPDARVIVLARDPRDILLSQKNKWKQYKSVDGVMHIRELLRAWANYHPLLLSQMWKQAMISASHFSDNDRVKWIHFEDLLSNSKQITEDICRFVGIPFDEKMLEVPASRSTLSKNDSAESGISAAPIARWKTMLHNTDIFWCQQIAGKQMLDLGYELESRRFNPVSIVFSALLFPLKAFIALSLNFSQSRNLIGSIRRRLIG